MTAAYPVVQVCSNGIAGGSSSSKRVQGEGPWSSSSSTKRSPEGASISLPLDAFDPDLPKTLGLAIRLEDARLTQPPKQQLRLFQQALRLRQCIARDPRTRNRLSPRCGLAICPSCATAHAVRNQTRVADKLHATRRRKCLFVTLTIVDLGSLPATFAAFVKAFTKLRTRKVWTSCIAGGCSYADLSPARADAATRWHVHSHIIVELLHGKRLSWARVENVWIELLEKLGTTGSVDIQAVTHDGYAIISKTRAQSPLAFYITKRQRGDLVKLDTSRLVELAFALRGTRTVTWFGSWRAPRKRSP